MSDSGPLTVSLRQPGPIPLAAEFAVTGGEVVALVGPSGSGKTTILRSIAGLYSPVQGLIRCGSHTWLDTEHNIRVAVQRRRVGLMFQSYALFPHLNARRNVESALDQLRGAQRRRRADELLAQVNLDGLSERLPRELSGGQQQRVALARALARDPFTLLLDEPFSAVDQVTRRKLRLELAALTRQLNIPIVFVTHDLDEAAMLAQRICVIRAGTSLQCGPPDEVFLRPRQIEVARLMDAVNLFTGIIRAHHAESSILSWNGLELAIAPCRQFQPGARVHWLVPPASVLLHQRRRPSNGERENPVAGKITELLTLNGLVTALISLDNPAGQKLTVQVPLHVVQRNYLAIDDRVGLSILGDAVHVMTANER